MLNKNFFGGINAGMRVELGYWCCEICVFLLYPCHSAHLLHHHRCYKILAFAVLLLYLDCMTQKTGGTMTLQNVGNFVPFCMVYCLNIWHHHCDNLKSCKVTVPQPINKLRPMQFRSQVWDLHLSQTRCIKLGFVGASVVQCAPRGISWLRQSAASLLRYGLGFIPWEAHIRCVVDSLALGSFILILQYYPVGIMCFI
jgi:hypothetical protein